MPGKTDRPFVRMGPGQHGDVAAGTARGRFERGLSAREARPQEVTPMIDVRKHAGSAVGAAVGLLVLATGVLLANGAAGRLRRPLEVAATDALGMEVRIAGPVGIGLLPDPHLTAGDCRVLGDSGTTIVSVRRVLIGIDVFAYFRGHRQLGRIELAGPHLFLVRDRGRRLNAERLRKALASVGMLDGAHVRITDGRLDYTDLAREATYEASGIGFEAHELRIPQAPAGDVRRALVLRGALDCREFHTGTIAITAVHLVLAAKNGTLDCSPMAMEVLGGRWKGALRADLSGPVPGFHLTGALRGLRTERFPGNARAKQRLVGSMDLSADLAIRGRTADEAVRSLAGTVSLQGSGLVLEGTDLDVAFSRYESTQNFNLVDLGAVFFAGPVGLAVTRGYHFGGLFRGAHGSSRIGRVVSEWTADHGALRAKDVAMATAANRIALTGRIDLVGRRFEDVTIAVVDAGGCARLRQHLHGSLGNPVMDKPKMLGSLAGPVLGLYRRTRRLLPEKPCVPFYSGSVAPPR